MKQEIFIYLPEAELAEITTVSWVVLGENNQQTYAKGTLSDFAAIAQGKRVTAVIGGKDVLSTQVSLPGTNRQKQLQALPYTLEDQLIDDVEDMHFALGQSLADDSYAVAIIEYARMANYVEYLGNAGIQLACLTADYMLLPFAADETTLLVDGEQIWLANESSRFTTSMALIDSAVVKEKINTGKLTLVSFDDSDTEKLKKIFSPDIIVNEVEVMENRYAWLAKHSGKENIINLMQGKFKQKKNWQQDTKRWLPAIALLCLWLFVEGGMFIYDYMHLSQQSKTLQAEMVKLYRNTFPRDKRVVDAYAQMQQKLGALKKTKGSSGTGFTELMTHSAPVLASFPGLEITTLRFHAGKIELDVTLANLQQLDKLKKQFNDKLGWKVEVQNASSDKNKVTARLLLSGAQA